MNEPHQIFDSRRAKELYSEYNMYRSGSFVVPPGYVALVELITKHDYFEEMTFTAVMTPTFNSASKECYDNNCGIAKRFRRWRCCQSLGANTEGSNNDAAAKTVVRWGWDNPNQEIVEFEFIDRPGNYYLIATKCNSLNSVIEDCDYPTIIQVSLIRASDAFQLGYDCCEDTTVVSTVEVAKTEVAKTNATITEF